MDKAREQKLVEGAIFADSPLAAAQGAEALVVATEWNDFAAVDLEELKEAMHTPLIFDGRNLFDPETVRAAGLTYSSIGRE
jgi:UDPglucose 6-dehydrogenase